MTVNLCPERGDQVGQSVRNFYKGEVKVICKRLTHKKGKINLMSGEKKMTGKENIGSITNIVKHCESCHLQIL